MLEDAATPDGDVPSDSGPDAGPRCIWPQVMNLVVDRPSYPPILRINFADTPECTGPLRIRVPESDDYEASVDLVVVADSDRERTFEYLGPRVPLFDDFARRRSFVFDEDEDENRFSLRMPVERLLSMNEDGEIQPGGMLFSYVDGVHLDVANTGAVVFDSNDDEALGAGTEGDVFMWTAEPRISGRDAVVSNIERFEGDSLPVISDDGDAIAFFEGSELYFRELNGSRQKVAVSGSPAGHLDLRNLVDGGHMLLSHHTRASTTGNVLLFRSETSSFVEPMDATFGRSGPGTLTIGSDYLGYAAIQGSELLEFSTTAPFLVTRTIGCASLEGLAFVYRGEGEQAEAYQCIDGAGARLAANGESVEVESVQDSWRLISASTNLEQLLVRDELGDTTAPYVVVDFRVGEARQRIVALDGSGDTRESVLVQNTTTCAALSPDGEWLVYSFASDASETEIYRIPVDTEMSSTPTSFPVED